MRAFHAVWVLALASCSSEPSLVVNVRTDLVSGIEFDEVETRSLSALPTRPHSILDRQLVRARRHQETIRVAELSGPREEIVLDVRLLRRGEVVLQRTVTAQRGARQSAITLVMSRDCRGLRCDNAEGAETCIAGRCQSTDCTVERPDACIAECVVGSECPVPETACAEARCDEGVCLQVGSGCPVGYYCNPDIGCRLEPGLGDAGVDDASVLDAASDGGRCIDGRPCSTGNPCEVGRTFCRDDGTETCGVVAREPPGTPCGSHAQCSGGECQLLPIQTLPLPPDASGVGFQFGGNHFAQRSTEGVLTVWTRYEDGVWAQTHSTAFEHRRFVVSNELIVYWNEVTQRFGYLQEGLDGSWTTRDEFVVPGLTLNEERPDPSFHLDAGTLRVCAGDFVLLDHDTAWVERMRTTPSSCPLLSPVGSGRMVETTTAGRVYTFHLLDASGTEFRTIDTVEHTLTVPTEYLQVDGTSRTILMSTSSTLTTYPRALPPVRVGRIPFTEAGFGEFTWEPEVELPFMAHGWVVHLSQIPDRSPDTLLAYIVLRDEFGYFVPSHTVVLERTSYGWGRRAVLQGPWRGSSIGTEGVDILVADADGLRIYRVD